MLLSTSYVLLNIHSYICRPCSIFYDAVYVFRSVLNTCISCFAIFCMITYVLPNAWLRSCNEATVLPPGLSSSGYYVWSVSIFKDQNRLTSGLERAGSVFWNVISFVLYLKTHKTYKPKGTWVPVGQDMWRRKEMHLRIHENVTNQYVRYHYRFDQMIFTPL